MSIKRITHIPIVVRDQDEALGWYQDKLGFEVCDDNSERVPGYRWLTVAPAGNRTTQFILMLPQQEEDEGRIGKNAMCVLSCDDVVGDCELFTARGVRILDGPTEAPWGKTLTIADLYGNPYYLVQANAPS